ncbi:Lrp/AsnC family transcriptional regulator [Variovorax paradoxus]|uniref:Lrp/AsnC family transcriptional regulator n=1 Tax=Variovorax paradoxus TaxID=34073 RepID=UPI0024794C95
MQSVPLDSMDTRMLEVLQGHGRISNLELAAAVGLSPAQCSRRHHRLEEEGVIARYEARLRPAAVGLRVMAFVHIAMERGHVRDFKRFRQAVTQLPDVLECHSVTGDVDYVLKVIARDLEALSTFLTEKLSALPGVSMVRSSVCLEELKGGAALPLTQAGA